MSRRSGRREGGFPPVPAPLPVPVVDSHTHLDIVIDPEVTGVAGTVSAALAAARSVGVDRLVQVGVDVETSRWGVAAANEHAELVATVAVHPNAAPRLADLG